MLREHGLPGAVRRLGERRHTGIGNDNGVLDPAEDFPGLGDTVSTDPNDPLPPTSALVVGTPNVVDGTTTWVTPATSLTIDRRRRLLVRRRDRHGDQHRRHTVDIGHSWCPRSPLPAMPTVSRQSAHQPSDPCRTGALTSSDADGRRHTADGHASRCPSPTRPRTTPTTSSLSAYTADDGVGVGVDASTFEVRLDGTLVSDAFVIDTYLLDAGLHTLKVVGRRPARQRRRVDRLVPGAGDLGEPAQQHRSVHAAKV